MADYLFSGSSLLLSANSGFSSVVCGTDVYTGMQRAGYFSATGNFSPTPMSVNSVNPSTAYGSITKIYDNSETVRPGDVLYLSSNCQLDDRWRQINPNYIKKMSELSGVYTDIYVTLSVSATSYNLQDTDLYPWGFSARLGQKLYSANLRFLNTGGYINAFSISDIGPYPQYNSDNDSGSAMLEISIKKPDGASTSASASFNLNFGLSGISYAR
jgi:hypothetical protein